MDFETLTKYDLKEKKRNRKKRVIITIILGIIILFLVLIAAYYFLVFKKTVKKTTVKKIPTVVKKLTVVNQDSNSRPIAIMIDNNVGNNLHAGLQDSYLNYEIIVEGGLTRIMALFKDKDISLIGPVRSSRHYFLDYAVESDAIYTHFGWSTYAQNDIQSLGINNINGLYDDAPFWRDTTIAAPHNVFTSIAKIYSYAETKGYSTTSTHWQLLNYTTDNIDLSAPIGTKTITNSNGKKEKVAVQNPELIAANNIVIPYSNYQIRSYTYDSTRKVYLRFMNNSPHIDKTTGAQLYYKNIIIEHVANRTLDDYGRQDLTTTGTGNGYYITNGYALPITWSKSSRTSKTSYTYTNGKKVKINDGNTFIQIEPDNLNPTIS